MGSRLQTHLMCLLIQKTLLVQQEISGPTSTCSCSEIPPCGYLSSHYVEPVPKADIFPYFIIEEFIYAENTVFTRLPAGQCNKRFILNSISLKFHHRRQVFLLLFLFILFFFPFQLLWKSLLIAFLRNIIPKSSLPPSLNWFFFFLLVLSPLWHTSLLFVLFFSPIIWSKETRKVTGYEHGKPEAVLWDKLSVAKLAWNRN